MTAFVVVVVLFFFGHSLPIFQPILPETPNTLISSGSYNSCLCSSFVNLLAFPGAQAYPIRSHSVNLFLLDCNRAGVLKNLLTALKR